MTKYSPQRTALVCRNIEAGLPLIHAAEAAGVHRSTHFEWMQNISVYSDAILTAEAKRIKKLQGVIDKAAEKSWQAAAWSLERRWPEHFGRTFGPAEKEQPAQVQISVVEVVPPALPAGDIVEVPPENVRELRPGE